MYSPQLTRPVKFLLDTDANILKHDVICYEDNPITLKGIDIVDVPQKTLCYSYLDLNFEINNNIDPFQVIQDKFPLDFDGIIGNDLLTKFQEKIDYINNVIILNENQIKHNTKLTDFNKKSIKIL